jgi:hypothetical protein
MNKRINGLWWQARMGYNNQNCDPEVVVKFAELIVRECIERVRSQCIHVRDSTIEGRPNPFFPDLRVRTEYEQGIVKCGVDSVIALEELIQESTDRWHKENILRDEE